MDGLKGIDLTNACNAIAIEIINAFHNGEDISTQKNLERIIKQSAHMMLIMRQRLGHEVDKYEELDMEDILHDLKDLNSIWKISYTISRRGTQRNRALFE
jgi:hypothetical protein